MGDISIIARRLKDGHVQYGWSGNGGYFMNVGLRLLQWYDDPELIEYLFGLGELRVIGKPGSEKGGYSWLYTHCGTGRPHELGTTERSIFNKIAFINYGYFYDTDCRWYYVMPEPFRVKIPLRYVYHATNEGTEYEFNMRYEINREIIKYMFGAYLRENRAFSDLLKEKEIDAEKMLSELLDDKFPVNRLFEKYNKIWSFFDDWVVVVTDEDDRNITGYILKEKAEKHIETIEWTI